VFIYLEQGGPDSRGIIIRASLITKIIDYGSYRLVHLGEVIHKVGTPMSEVKQMLSEIPPEDLR